MDGIAFELLGRAFGIATESAVAGDVARLFPALARPLQPGGADEVWALRSHGAQWRVEPPGLPTERFGRLTEALEAVEFLVTSRLLALHPDRPQLHAAGAVPRDRAVLAIGESGAGKSSIALHWSRAGIPVLGDDVVLLDERDRAVAFPRFFSVHRDRLAAAGVAPDEATPPGSTADEARYDPAGGAGWAGPAPVAVIGFVRRVAGATLSLEPLPAARALIMLVAALHSTGAGADRCFAQLARLVERARTVRLAFGDAGEAARALASLA